MVEIQQSRDTCIDKLTSTRGKDLEIMANIVDSKQMNAIMEGYVCSALNVSYGINKYEMLLRCSVSYRGRGREDLTGIGKTPENPAMTTREVSL